MKATVVWIQVCTAMSLAIAAAPAADVAEDTSVLSIETQRRVKSDDSAGEFRVVRETEQWETVKTTITSDSFTGQPPFRFQR